MYVTVLGAGPVGRSHLIFRFTQNRFIDDYDATLHDIHDHKVLVDGQVIDLQIEEIAYCDEDVSWIVAAMRRSSGTIIVYAIDDAWSFDAVEELHAQWVQWCREETHKVMIFGNKSDKEKDRVVTTEQGAALARSLNALFREGSALTGADVEEAFYDLVREIISARARGSTASGSEVKQGRRKKLCGVC